MVNKVKQLNINKLKYWWRMLFSWEGKQRRLLVPRRLCEQQQNAGSLWSCKRWEAMSTVSIFAQPPGALLVFYRNVHFVFIKAVKLDPCKSCPLIQLIDFAVISHSLLNTLSILCSLSFFPTSLWALDGSWTFIERPSRYLGFQQLRIMCI